jgi:hypothetical protein
LQEFALKVPLRPSLKKIWFAVNRPTHQNHYLKQLVNARPFLINYLFAENQLTILELGR